MVSCNAASGVRRFGFPCRSHEDLRDNPSTRPWDSQWPHKYYFSRYFPDSWGFLESLSLVFPPHPIQWIHGRRHWAKLLARHWRQVCIFRGSKPCKADPKMDYTPQCDRGYYRSRPSECYGVGWGIQQKKFLRQTREQMASYRQEEEFVQTQGPQSLACLQRSKGVNMKETWEGLGRRERWKAGREWAWCVLEATLCTAVRNTAGE